MPSFSSSENPWPFGCNHSLAAQRCLASSFQTSPFTSSSIPPGLFRRYTSKPSCHTNHPPRTVHSWSGRTKDNWCRHHYWNPTQNLRNTVPRNAAITEVPPCISQAWRCSCRCMPVCHNRTIMVSVEAFSRDLPRNTVKLARSIAMSCSCVASSHLSGRNVSASAP